MSEPIKHPAWKQAVEDFLKLGEGPGYVCTKVWLAEALRLTPPREVEDKERYDLDYLSGVDSFRRELLEKHCIAFKTVRGEGLQYLTAQEQVEYATEERDRIIGKALRFGARTLMYLRSDQLNVENRAAHADQLAKHAQLASVIKRTRALPSPFKAMLEKKDAGCEP